MLVLGSCVFLCGAWGVSSAGVFTHSIGLSVASLVQSALFKACPLCSAHIRSTTPAGCRGPTTSRLSAPTSGPSQCLYPSTAPNGAAMSSLTCDPFWACVYGQSPTVGCFTYIRQAGSSSRRTQLPVKHRLDGGAALAGFSPHSPARLKPYPGNNLHRRRRRTANQQSPVPSTHLPLAGAGKGVSSLQKSPHRMCVYFMWPSAATSVKHFILGLTQFM